MADLTRVLDDDRRVQHHALAELGRIVGLIFAALTLVLPRQAAQNGIGIADGRRRRRGHIGLARLGAEQLGLGVVAIDLLPARRGLDSLNLAVALGRGKPVQLAEGHHVHQVKVARQVRVLQPLEGKRAVHAQVQRLHVAASGERLDGQRVAHAHAVQGERRRQLVVEELVAAHDVAVIDAEEFRQQLAHLVFLTRQLLLQLGAEHGGLLAIELQHNLFHLGRVLLDEALQIEIGGDLFAAFEDGVVDVVEAVRGLELHLRLVRPLRKEESPSAGRNGRAIDDLHAIERLGEGGQVGPHVAQHQHVRIAGQGRDAILEKLQRRQRIQVEFVPEAGSRGPCNRCRLLGRDGLVRQDLAHVGHVGGQYADDLADVIFLGLDGRLDVLACLLAADEIAKFLQHHVDGVSRWHHGGRQAHRNHRLHVGNR